MSSNPLDGLTGAGVCWRGCEAAGRDAGAGRE